jgi:exodeoxyribonuclease VII small subunit
MAKKLKRKTIEEKLNKLDEIIKRFERGKIDIEEGIEEYEKAAKLIKAVKKELTSLEVKIEKIRESY